MYLCNYLGTSFSVITKTYRACGIFYNTLLPHLGQGIPLPVVFSTFEEALGVCESVLEAHSLPLAWIRAQRAQLQGRPAEGGQEGEEGRELICDGTLGDDVVNFEPTSSLPHHTLTGVTHPPVHTHSSRRHVPSAIRPVPTPTGTTSVYWTEETLRRAKSVAPTQNGGHNEWPLLSPGHSYRQEKGSGSGSGSGLSRATTSVSGKTRGDEERRRRVLSLTRSFKRGCHGDDATSCQLQQEQEKERFLRFLG